jgi:hippurate hydrolase
MGSEDFSFMLKRVPGCYLFIGNGDTAPVHHPAYDFNDEAIPYGVAFWNELAQRVLPKA